MNEAIRTGKNWKRSNTEVEHDSFGTDIYLHGNLICHISKQTGTREYFSQDWHTVTTKSRLNALGADLHIKDFTLTNRDGSPFREGQTN